MTQNIKAAVQKQFNQVAANYSVSAVHARGEDLAHMLQAVPLRGQEVVLDAGCGTGHTALTFAPHVAQVVALDFTEGMLAQGQLLAAERGLTNIEFRQGDVESLPFAAGEFDLVVSRLSAHHWPHPQTALREFHRVLRPGAYFILSDTVSFADFGMDTYLQAIELLRDPSHVRDHTIDQWLAMCADAGFAAEVIFRWGIWLDFADWVRRMATPARNIAAIQSLFESAPADLRDQLQVAADFSFTLPGALFRARRVG